MQEGKIWIMSLEKAKKYLEEKEGYADHVIELEESRSATVQLAAEALGVEQGMIRKDDVISG